MDINDVREIMFKKSTRDRFCNYLSRLYVRLDIIWTGFMDIKLFMIVTDRNFNMFDSRTDLISLYDINSGLSILQSTYSFKKLNAKKI